MSINQMKFHKVPSMLEVQHVLTFTIFRRTTGSGRKSKGRELRISENCIVDAI